MKSSVNLILKSARAGQRCRIRNHASRTFSSADKASSDYVQGSTTHFGFENVPIEEKESKVRSVFQNVAESYDVMNDFMSGGELF